MNGKLGLILIGAALTLSACSASRNMLGLGDAPAPASQPTIQTNNPLALPPDLALRQPGAASTAYQANTDATAPLDATGNDLAAPSAPTAPAARAPQRDVFAEYGVSRTNPDGTAKPTAQLEKELKAAILKRKQQQNPNYGTIFNMGSVFRDG